MSSHASLRIGLTGLGGYAGSLCNVLESCSQEPQSGVRLAAVCEPDQAAHSERIHGLRNRGVQVVNDFDELLGGAIDAVCLPLPIHLHRSYTERACAAGKAVLCEKPAAGCIDDLDAMIGARDRHRVPVAIGFQDIYDPATLALKREILSGTIGRIQQVTVAGCWPRTHAYYTRNGWAGKSRFEGMWVLDSPANNAMAHFINLALFLAGPDVRRSANPVSVEAELYRANPIASYDTCAMRVGTDVGAEMLFLLTHACTEMIQPVIRIRAERGFASFGQITRAQLAGPNGQKSWTPLRETRPDMFGTFARWVRGGDEVVATLEVARSHLLVVNGASEAALIHNVPSAFVQQIPRESTTVTSIQEIEATFQLCAESGKLPSEIGTSWARPGGSRSLVNYSHFAGPAKLSAD